MSDHTFAITHLVGTSTESVDQAIRNGIKTAGQTLRNMDWFEIEEIRGSLNHSDQVHEYQVTIKLGFRHD